MSTPRRPTRTERDNTAAWLAFNARVQARAEAAVRALLIFLGCILAALALVHWATPCAEAALCLAPLAVHRQAPRRLAAWWRRTCRRLHIHVLRVRLQQLLGTAQEMALDTGPDPRPCTALRLGAVMARAAALRLDLVRLEQADAQDRRLQRLQA